MSNSAIGKRTFLAILIFATTTSLAPAQSSQRPAAPRTVQPHTIQRSVPNMQQHTSRKIGMSGYCPVCVTKMKKWVKGKPEFHSTYDGITYYFPGQDQRDMFAANPVAYVPALGGDCTVCYASHGKRVSGSVKHASMFGGRLFLFPGADQKAAFAANIRQFVNVDLAHKGNCVVCQTEMGREAPGKPEFTVIHNGFRYQFPGTKQLNMFVANPAKYVANPLLNSPIRTSNSTPKRADTQEVALRKMDIEVTVNGRSGCAGCDHGVLPVGSPGELGLAIVTGTEVVVVEDAHRLYPKVYEQRFDGLNLAVTGKVIKRAGKVTWIQPSNVRVVN